MLSNVRLSKDFWAEVVSTACYLVNCSPLIATDCKNGLVLLLIIQIFFFVNKNVCHAYCHVNEGMLDLRSKKCILLGYANGVKG